jgi:hypothetical protein
MTVKTFKQAVHPNDHSLQPRKFASQAGTVPNALMRPSVIDCSDRGGRKMAQPEFSAAIAAVAILFIAGSALAANERAGLHTLSAVSCA